MKTRIEKVRINILQNIFQVNCQTIFSNLIQIQSNWLFSSNICLYNSRSSITSIKLKIGKIILRRRYIITIVLKLIWYSLIEFRFSWIYHFQVNVLNLICYELIILNNIIVSVKYSYIKILFFNILGQCCYILTPILDLLKWRKVERNRHRRKEKNPRTCRLYLYFVGWTLYLRLTTFSKSLRINSEMNGSGANFTNSWNHTTPKFDGKRTWKKRKDRNEIKLKLNTRNEYRHENWSLVQYIMKRFFKLVWKNYENLIVRFKNCTFNSKNVTINKWKIIRREKLKQK